MAVRLQMKLGVVAEQDRLPDSPDTVVVVEPSVGSVARSKGHLYLLVTSRTAGRHVHEATRLTAETIRNEYYYDESAGIRVCIQKAVAAANKRLTHQRDRLGLGHGPDGGPIGIGVAVVRGNELYVATVGPAEAYLIRQARLSTLPDPHRERGLPGSTGEPDVWRGEIAVGDSLVLISPNVMTRLGPDELKDAMVTLHPQSAMEHLHHRFVAADGSGSDGAIAFEATEVAATHKQRTLVPVWAPEPLAGAPDRSPIPLADPVADGVAAVQSGATRAREAAGTVLDRAVLAVQDLLPRRRPAYRRVTPAAAKRETQRRAALAVLALVLVATGLGMGVYAFAGSQPKEPISSITAAERALKVVRDNLARVSGPGIDLIVDDRRQALELLTEAWQELQAAERARVPASTIRPLRERITAGLDRLHGMRDVGKTALFTFEPGETPTDLGALVTGPDGAPYVLDRGTKAVYRINLEDKEAVRIFREGAKAAGATQGTPLFIATGGPDLLVLDDKNVLWRWRPSNSKGKGTTTRIGVNGAASWGDDVRGIGTYLRSAEAGLYNLYVVDPSEEQILAYSPAADGSGFPARPTNRLSTKRDVAHMTSLYIDGDIFVIENGLIERFLAGKSDGWDAEPPGDELLRPAPKYTLIAAGTERRAGRLYGYDPANERLIAFEKANGTYVEQYRLAGEDRTWRDLRGMIVRAGIEDEPDTLVWIDRDSLYETVLEPLSATGGRSPSPSASNDTGEGEGSPEPSAKEADSATP